MATKFYLRLRLAGATTNELTQGGDCPAKLDASCDYASRAKNEAWTLIGSSLIINTLCITSIFSSPLIFQKLYMRALHRMCNHAWMFITPVGLCIQKTISHGNCFGS